MPHRALTDPWWTPWPGTGPRRDLLGDLTGLTVVELGCGNGDNAAAVAASGALVTGIDHDPAKIEHARQRWHGTRELRFEHADAATYLGSLPAGVGRHRLLHLRRPQLHAGRAAARPHHRQPRA